jgi:hypothetical protein
MAVYISQVIQQYRESGMTTQSRGHSIGYRKADGSWGEKHGVRRRPGDFALPPKKDLSSIKHENKHAGKLYLLDSGGGKFELFICLLVEWNGHLINHSF